MSVAIIGTVALDGIETPSGKHDRVLGGSATYAATAASLFTQVGVVSIVGKDFPDLFMSYFKNRKINVDGVEKSKTSDTFYWSGYYEKDMNKAFTKETQLNCLNEFDPLVPDSWRESRIVFLANVDPLLQQKAILQFTKPQLIILDTMNYWIQNRTYELTQAIKSVDILILNDQEARLLTGIDNIIKAIPELAKLGPKRIIVKKGEHGALMYASEKFFCLPGFPVSDVLDPTGAGDSFAGGFAGYLDSQKIFTEKTFQNALIMGIMVSSFTVQDIGTNLISKLTKPMLDARFKEYKSMVNLPDTL